MNRFEQTAHQIINTPALALDWPSGLVAKLDQTIKQKRPRDVHLSEEENALLAAYLDSPRGWFNHHGVQIVLHPGKIFRLC